MRIIQHPRNLRADRAGSVLPMAAIGLTVLLSLSGAAVDFSRAYMARSRLQAACDAGALAGRKSVSAQGFDSAAKRVAETYFTANFDNQAHQADTFTIEYTSPDSGSTVAGAAEATVETLLLHFVGIDEIEIASACSATMSVGNSDVTMVLDTTGSMSGTRIEALRTAMKNFYDTVTTATAGSNARVRYAFVPYSSSVNIGKLVMAVDPDFIADSTPIQSRAPMFSTRTVSVFDHWGDPVITTAPGSTSSVKYGSWSKVSSTAYSRSKTCENNLPANTAWTNDGSASSGTQVTVNGAGQQVTTITYTQPQTSTVYQCTRYPDRNYYIERAAATRDAYSYRYETRDPVNVEEEQQVFSGFIYKRVTYDTSGYKNGDPLTYLDDSGREQATVWGGCVEERATINSSSFSYNSITGYDPAEAIDLEIDAGFEDDTDGQWKPMVGQVAYLRGYYRNGSFRPQNGDTYTSGAQPGSLFYVCPTEVQLLTEMSKSEFYAYANSLQVAGSTWHDIGAIWGGRVSSPDGIFANNVNEQPENGGEVARHMIFMTDGEMNADNLVYSSYGIEFHDKRTTADGASNADSIHNSRFLAVCEAIKAKGIRLWVIAFGTSLTSSLTTCASSQSAYRAANATELNASFQEIAKQVGELRITQ